MMAGQAAWEPLRLDPSPRVVAGAAELSLSHQGSLGERQYVRTRKQKEPFLMADTNKAVTMAVRMAAMRRNTIWN